MSEDLAEILMQAMAEETAREIDKQILDHIIWEATLKDHPDWTLVQIKWEKGKNSDYFWNEACAWAIEQFGLPGENYVTHPTETYMDFLFKRKEDAILMTLKWI